MRNVDTRDESTSEYAHWYSLIFGGAASFVRVCFSRSQLDICGSVWSEDEMPKSQFDGVSSLRTAEAAATTMTGWFCCRLQTEREQQQRTTLAKTVDPTSVDPLSSSSRPRFCSLLERNRNNEKKNRNGDDPSTQTSPVHWTGRNFHSRQWGHRQNITISIIINTYCVHIKYLGICAVYFLSLYERKSKFHKTVSLVGSILKVEEKGSDRRWRHTEYKKNATASSFIFFKFFWRFFPSLFVYVSTQRHTRLMFPPCNKTYIKKDKKRKMDEATRRYYLQAARIK